MKKSNEYLDIKLKEYGASDVYPFHMPGHKRQPVVETSDGRSCAKMGDDKSSAKIGGDEIFYHASQIDITEVSGFDNLHHAEGIIACAQERMAEVFGADRSFFLVNGSTCGLLAAISAAVSRGGKILIARNCHKAVYNAIYLRDLSVEYVYPVQTVWGIQGSIDPEDIRKAFDKEPQIQAVLITSPTYDGVVSDIETIAQIAHEHNIPLIVDEAHGAHFGFSAGFPKKALALGADVVIESIHKTLPAFTQSAALHLKGDRVSVEKLQKFLGIYQSSSPSYLLMAGLDRCVRILKEQGPSLMREYEKRLARFYHRIKGLKYLNVLTLDGIREYAKTDDIYSDCGIWDKEASKILISCQNAGMNGQQLANRLLEDYGLEMEMVSGHYVTALTSMMDTEEGFDRLEFALRDIDEKMEERAKQELPSAIGDERGYHADEIKSDWCQLMEALYQPKKKQMEIAAATEHDAMEVSLTQAVGYISTEFAYLYPPGIPFLAPGEEIPDDLPKIVERFLAEGFEIQGLADASGKRIKVASI